MIDYIEIECVPVNEQCAQVGCDDFERLSKKECRAYINQLTRVYGAPPVGCGLFIGSCPHDFGTYYEVRIRYDDSNETCLKYAFGEEGIDGVEMGCMSWDDTAKAELGDEYFIIINAMTQ